MNAFVHILSAILFPFFLESVALKVIQVPLFSKISFSRSFSSCPFISFTLLERSSWTHGSMIPNDDCDSFNLGILLFKDVSVKTDDIFSVSTPLFVQVIIFSPLNTAASFLKSLQYCITLISPILPIYLLNVIMGYTFPSHLKYCLIFQLPLQQSSNFSDYYRRSFKD